MFTWIRLSNPPIDSATFLVITKITSFVDSLSLKRPTTLAKVVRLVIGLVILITVPIGAVRCNTSFLLGSRLESSIQVATPFSFFSNRPKRFGLFILRSTALLLSWLVVGFVESCVATG